MKLDTFPIIDQRYFGGDQAWIPDKRQSAGSCGVIAAANLVEYYRGHHQLTKAAYMTAVRSLYHWLAPIHWYNPFAAENTYGLPFFKRYIRRVAGYLNAIGIRRQPEFFRGRGLGAAQHFIRRSIAAGDPVILLVIGHRKLKRYNNHYVTITGYSENDFGVYFSTWGAEESVPLRLLYERATIFRMARLRQI